MPKAKGSYTEYQIMYEKDTDATTRLFYVTAESVLNAIEQFRLSHITEEILSVVKL
jgi:hypothetical protein